MTKPDFSFTAVFKIFKFHSFHSTRRDARVRFDSDMIFLDQSQFFATHTVTNEISSFCIDIRLRQMAFFVFAKVGKGRAKASFCVMLKYFEVNKSFMCGNLYCYNYIKQRDSMLPCICLVIDHRRRQNVVRTSVTHSAMPSVPFFVFTTF